ncbi:MAG TPA: DUF4350 domain-containing protein, partial [Actinotalea sp.]|nr:DUF4350 domain-containing protein [Actinotalea sp.]
MTATAAPVRLGGEPPRSVAERRWRAARWPLVIVITLLVSVLASALIQPQTSAEPLAVDNPGASGVRALAQVLGRQGVEVRETRSVSEAVARADAGTTLAVVDSWLLTDEDVDALAETRADLVLVAPEFWVVEPLTDGAVTTGWDASSAPRQARCEDADARAAGELAGAQYTVTLVGGRGTVCFPGSGDTASGAYAVVEQGGRTVRVLGDSTILTNGSVTEAGNGALALRALGKHDRLTWLRPSLT